MTTNVYSPCTGEIIDISETSDEIFASKTVGDGMAIIPNSNLICAPFDGTIRNIFPTNHAFTIKSDSGIYILIHIGIETVALQGKCFKRLEEENKTVRKGTPIIKVDFNMIRRKKLDPSVLVVLLENEIIEKTQCKTSNELGTFLFSAR